MTPEEMGDEQWFFYANCRGKAFELFEYQDQDSPLAKDMSYDERYAFNKTNFELAAEICIECPVFFECGRDATAADREWTVRQGEPPERFGPDYSHQEMLEANPDGRMCKRKHFVPAGSDRCHACAAYTRQLRKQRAREAKQGV